MSKNCNFLTLFTKTPVPQNNSRKTGRDRKLKFGMDLDDPYYFKNIYYMFLKVGYAFVDICFGF